MNPLHTGRQVQAHQQGQVEEFGGTARETQVAAATTAAAAAMYGRDGDPGVNSRGVAAAEPGRGAGGERRGQLRGGAEEGAVQAPRRLRLPRPRPLQAVRGVMMDYW